jgi:hypothetical protein
MNLHHSDSVVALLHGLFPLNCHCQAFHLHTFDLSSFELRAGNSYLVCMWPSTLSFSLLGVISPSIVTAMIVRIEIIFRRHIDHVDSLPVYQKLGLVSRCYFAFLLENRVSRIRIQTLSF